MKIVIQIYIYRYLNKSNPCIRRNIFSSTLEVLHVNNLTKYWLILIKPYGVDYINNDLSPFTSKLVLAITG